MLSFLKLLLSIKLVCVCVCVHERACAYVCKPEDQCESNSSMHNTVLLYPSILPLRSLQDPSRGKKLVYAK